MAAVRARRSGGGKGGGRGSESRGGRHRAPAVPAYESMPRLARIKLSGGLSPGDVQVTGRSLAMALTGGVLFLGIAVAGAAWLGSSLFDASEAFARSADATVANAGFQIEDIQVAQLPGSPTISEAREQEVRALIVPEGRHSILALDPQDVKARVESLDWVANARVRRLWPSSLLVEVERRQEYAIWQDENRQSAVIDANGERLLTERVEDHANLLRVVGRGAGPAAPPILAALEGMPDVRERTVELVRIGDRRWDLRLTSGAVVALPEEGSLEALAQLQHLQQQYALLDRPVQRLDMRAPGRLAVRIHPALEGAPLMGGV
ncbi:MAG: cell division protein FtsQ/DivIB [Hyphomonadaceae bacterium]|nr:cell division protein FtsQ/DivIB [Hyphomonadaceae bacterium]MCA8886394.1 cell division protein FtsQ/DivIB [Hyphomonadaceae bacterium]